MVYKSEHIIKYHYPSPTLNRLEEIIQAIKINCLMKTNWTTVFHVEINADIITSLAGYNVALKYT